MPAPMMTHFAVDGTVSLTALLSNDDLCLAQPVRGLTTGATVRLKLIYHEAITFESLSTQAYGRIRRMIVRLQFAPGDVLSEHELQDALGIGRTPVREALQRLARDQFVTVIPRQGMFVASIDVGELSMLHETRAIMEPYAARLACVRGVVGHWAEMADVIEQSLRAGVPPDDLLAVDRRCHEIIWDAAGNRFLTDTLDNLYAHSDRVWHMYLADVADTRHAVDEHIEILDLLRTGDADACATAVEAHVRSFDDQVRDAVMSRLHSPLAG